MKILPIFKKEADKKHWVVRWLRYYGFFICIAAIIAGVYYGNFYGAMLFGGEQNETMAWIYGVLSLLIGGFLGFVAGLTISLPCWAISMAIDDMHAMRQYMQGFVTMGDKRDIE